MNVTIYTLNNWLLYLIYLHKGCISVITIIAVQLEYSRDDYIMMTTSWWLHHDGYVAVEISSHLCWNLIIIMLPLRLCCRGDCVAVIIVLPWWLCCHDNCVAMVIAAAIDDETARLEKYKYLLGELPRVNYIALKKLTTHLCR